MSESIGLSHHEELPAQIGQKLFVVEIVQKHFAVELFDERIFTVSRQNVAIERKRFCTRHNRAVDLFDPISLFNGDNLPYLHALPTGIFFPAISMLGNAEKLLCQRFVGETKSMEGVWAATSPLWQRTIFSVIGVDIRGVDTKNVADIPNVLKITQTGGIKERFALVAHRAVSGEIAC